MHTQGTKCLTREFIYISEHVCISHICCDMCLNSSIKALLFFILETSEKNLSSIASNFFSRSSREKNLPLSIIHHHAASISNRIVASFIRNCDIFSESVKFYFSGEEKKVHRSARWITTTCRAKGEPMAQTFKLPVSSLRHRPFGWQVEGKVPRGSSPAG